jgi:hypothetical protein
VILCTPWITGDDVAECCSVETTDGAIFDTAAEQASELLFQLSGRQFPGECEKTVRPSCDPCWCGYQILSRGHVVGPWDWGYPLAGLCGGCLVACSPSLVKLSGYPVREITEVLINGVALVAGTDYRLYNSRYLMRLDDGHWPWAQDLTLPNSEDNTFSVTYSYGADPPSLGVSAAAQLACEIYRACSGESCALPAGVTRIQRQGITIDKLAFTNWGFLGGVWRTGLSLVDAFLSAYNPSNLQRRPVFFAPGKRQYAQRWQG